MKRMASVTSNFVQKIFSLRNKWFCQDHGQASSQLNKPDYIFLEVQKILIWSDPFSSCCCIVAVNILFWLIIYLDLTFFDIIFTILLALICEQLWVDHFSKYLDKYKSDSQNLMPDSSRTSDTRTLSSSDFSPLFSNCRVMFKETFAKARFFRQTQPGMFCLVTCLGFLLFGVIGRSLPGVLVVYILLMLLMTVPGAIAQFLPADVIKNLTDFFYSSRKESCSNNDDEVEPYLPDTNEEALELLKLAGDLQQQNKDDDEESNDFLLERLSERTSDTAESVCSKLSLFPESAVMPSPENSMDVWEFDLPLEEKTEMNETENSGINFQSKHFDGDSSEEEFIRGLDIKEEIAKEVQKNQTPQSTSILGTENFISMGKKLIETELNKKSLRGNDKDSSSDTDSFELISEEDM